MRFRLSRKENVIISVLALVLVLVFAGVYFLKVHPLKTDLETKNKSLKTEEQLLAILQGKEKETEEFTAASTTQMQVKIPVKPLVEQLILDLDKAEVVSGSKILSMNFAKDGEVSIPEQTEEEKAAEAEEESTSAETSEEAANADETPDGNEAETGQDGQTAQKPVSLLEVPEGVKKVTIQLSVESPGYEELEKFIATIEGLKRIVIVEAIDYTGGAEITTLQQKNDPLKFTVTVSAFYMPELKDLVQQLPNVSAPESAKKRNPLSSFTVPEEKKSETNEN
ncbi:hypothetical protein D1B31_10585 [Neobacillus notoginsengisoli]|uniref:Pilus assembly protein PilO n=1 Tax=Neobacillus notoginsengisoli TaxID=1578198 RepID=A0A417YU14_9BACI|nr:hypothetical protein [Neobacillus notoginsengisoli]RHW40638.1 hypothetical protein D1B31_10585 [Neobacillus notoginsengisoli]